MLSLKIFCLVFSLQILIAVCANKKSKDEKLNYTVAEDRSDIYMKKPPRKRGTLGLSYGTSFGHGYHASHLKSFSQLKKEQTPTFIEKYIPVPIHVRVPVDRPYPVHVPKLYPVTVEKAVPVPIKVNVPQPYPVYKKVAVPVRVPVDRPVPIQILKPVAVLVEKQVPYPVDKPIPVPVKVPVDRPYPVYIPFEKATEKPTSAQLFKFMPPEKSFPLAAGKSLTWIEKPDTSAPSSFKVASSSDDVDNEKLLSSLFDSPESSESEITWPESIDWETKK